MPVAGNEGMDKQTETLTLLGSIQIFHNNQQAIGTVEGRVLGTLIADMQYQPVPLLLLRVLIILLLG